MAPPSKILIIPSNSLVNWKIFVEKLFPDKFCPVSGFVPNCPDSWIFFNPWFRHAQNEDLWWSPMSPMFPGRPDPVFAQNPVFQKLYIWSLYILRNFFAHIFSRIQLVRDPDLPWIVRFHIFSISHYLGIHRAMIYHDPPYLWCSRMSGSGFQKTLFDFFSIIWSAFPLFGLILN